MPTASATPTILYRLCTFVWLTVFVLSAYQGQCQGDIASDNRERIFAFEVKQIDEFIERFNDDSASFIRGYIKTYYPTVHVDRQSLVRNLFDKKRSWDKASIDSFLVEVLDTASPVYLDFYSRNWFAEAFCSCTYQGKPAEAVVLLKVSTDSTGGSKWIVEDAYCKAIPEAGGTAPLELPDPGSKFLNPISHTTDFIGLARAFHDREHIRDYLDTNFLASARSRAFLRALMSGTLSYQYVKGIHYHFLDVSGWVFTVSYFKREEANSGWLISRLQRADEQQKEAYKTLYFK